MARGASPYTCHDEDGFGDYETFLTRGLISPSPGQAVRRIVERYGSVPNRLGTNCLGLAVLRGIVSQLSIEEKEAAHGLIFVAAHTHWEPAPILYTFDAIKDRYRVGPQRGAAPFKAVGFVFTSSGAQPYEWADASCVIDAGELDRVWSVIDRLNDAVVGTSWYAEGFPFGVSINFRFKACFAPPVTSTYEVPGEENDRLSYIYRASALENIATVHGDQVGWSAAAPPDISEGEEVLLREIEGIFLNEVPKRLT